jgi:hypothetical protein
MSGTHLMANYNNLCELRMTLQLPATGTPYSPPPGSATLASECSHRCQTTSIAVTVPLIVCCGLILVRMNPRNQPTPECGAEGLAATPIGSSHATQTRSMRMALKRPQPAAAAWPGGGPSATAVTRALWARSAPVA